MVARGTRASFFGEGDALRPMACPTRCRSAPLVVLRVAAWRRSLSYVLPLGRLLLRIITRTLLFLLPRLGLRAVSVLSASLSRALFHVVTN